MRRGKWRRRTDGPVDSFRALNHGKVSHTNDIILKSDEEALIHDNDATGCSLLIRTAN